MQRLAKIYQRISLRPAPGAGGDEAASVEAGEALVELASPGAGDDAASVEAGEGEGDVLASAGAGEPPTSVGPAAAMSGDDAFAAAGDAAAGAVVLAAPGAGSRVALDVIMPGTPRAPGAPGAPGVGARAPVRPSKPGGVGRPMLAFLAACRGGKKHRPQMSKQTAGSAV